MSTTYSLLEHAVLLQDRARVRSYVRALRRYVRPDSAVLEIGSGVGFFALVATRLGAASVIGLEPDDIVLMARYLLEPNQASSKVVFTQVTSQEFEGLRADVVVSDLRGVLPMFENNIAAIIDVRSRLLRDSGVIIPRADRLCAALIDAPQTYSMLRTPWKRPLLGIDMRDLLPFALSDWVKVYAHWSQLVTPPAVWACIDYRTVTSEDVAGAARWVMDDAETAHGVLVWFEAELAEGVYYSSGPDNPGSVYGQAFFPFSAPLECPRGCEVNIELRTWKKESEYQWEWTAAVSSEDRTGRHIRKYSQTTVMADLHLRSRPNSICSQRRSAAESAVEFCRAVPWFCGRSRRANGDWDVDQCPRPVLPTPAASDSIEGLATAASPIVT
jgi:type I protein arginine methyltransferase